MSKLIPNTFQYPNIYIDKLSFFLSPEEEKVLNHAIRAILGWEDSLDSRSAHIALSIFTEGKFKKDKPKTEENRLSFGCGLCLNAVREALAALDKYNILIKVGSPTQDGQLYTLQINDEAVDWAGLEARRAAQTAANQKRTRQATLAAKTKRGVSSDDRGYRPTIGVSSDDRGVTSDDRQGVTSDDNNETQFKPSIIINGGDVNLSGADSLSKKSSDKKPIIQPSDEKSSLSLKQIRAKLRQLDINPNTNRSNQLAQRSHLTNPRYLDAWTTWLTTQNGDSELTPGGILIALENEDWPPGWSDTGEPPAAIKPPIKPHVEPVVFTPLPSPDETSPDNQRWRTIVLSQLQMQMTQATFDTWVKNTRVLRREDGHLVVGTKSAFAKDWLENRLYSTILRTVGNAFMEQPDPPAGVKFIIDQDGTDNGRQLEI